jgi:A/G-specific adenine glycosylase
MASSPHSTGATPEADSLLRWYDRQRRILPWRAPPDQQSDPYAVWLSEIMLQQTTVATVGPYFSDFVTRWPTVGDLAAASLDEVLHAWQGLGYYARARNLHACAQAVVERFGGVFPDTEAGLLELPGVGAYTAAAIAAIAFDRPAAVMDGNVERVMARYFAVETPLPEAKPALRAYAASLTPEMRPGDYAQAVMDLGATICTPRKPRCMLCPWTANCRARILGDPERLPVKKPKPERPIRHGVAFWIVRQDGAVLIRRRAEKGLLGGMMEFPSTEWRAEPWISDEAVAASPVLIDRVQPLTGTVIHVFTHFQLNIDIIVARPTTANPAGGVWVQPTKLRDYALPTVMKKIERHALAGLKAANNARGDSTPAVSRSFATIELPEAKADAISASRIDERHAHLDKMLDE